MCEYGKGLSARPNDRLALASVLLALADDLLRSLTIFRACCRESGLAFDEAAYRGLLERCYSAPERGLRACHPRDLVRQMSDLAAYLELPDSPESLGTSLAARENALRTGSCGSPTPTST